MKVVKLVIEPAETAGEQARQSIAMARQQISDPSVQRDLINPIETIIVCKLPQKSRESIAAILNLSQLKQTPLGPNLQPIERKQRPIEFYDRINYRSSTNFNFQAYPESMAGVSAEAPIVLKLY